MGEQIEIVKIEAENNGTLVQVDFKSSREQGRLFIEVRDIFRVLNNYLHETADKEMEKQGFEKIKDWVNPNLIPPVVYPASK